MKRKILIGSGVLVVAVAIAWAFAAPVEKSKAGDVFPR